MKRLLWAVVVPIGLSAASARADYIVIRVVPSGGDTQMAQGGLGTPGGGGPGIGKQGAGGYGGGGMMSPGGRPGNGAPGSGSGGGMMSPGGRPGNGAPGSGGMMSPGGGGGRLGVPGQGGRGMMGRGGQPGMGRGGRMGLPGVGGLGGEGLPGSTGNQAPEFDPNTPQVWAVIEMHGRDKDLYRAPRIKTRWGETVLFNDNQTISYWYVRSKSLKFQFEERKRNLEARKSPDKIHELARWALVHGLVDQCGELLDELAKEAPKSKELSGPIAATVKAYSELKARKVLEPNPHPSHLVGPWRQRLGQSFKVIPGDQYDVLHNIDSDSPSAVKVRLDALDRQYRGFYYWFALKGVALPQPAERMLIVVFSTAADFQARRRLYDDSPLTEQFLFLRQNTEANASTVAIGSESDKDKLPQMTPLHSDGFLARNSNVLFMSPTRLDAASVDFASMMKGLYDQGWDRSELLLGHGSLTQTVAKKLPANEKRQMIPRMMTLALVDRALEEESAEAVASYEGTRQLLAATGLQPASLQVPEWLQFGMASVFETPKGPYASALGLGKAAYWNGIGGPSWSYLRAFKDLVKANKLGRKPAELLHKVVSNGFFQETRAGTDKDGLYKAETLSWALCYYLAQAHLPELLKFQTELARLPRELELDEATVTAAFARSFGLSDESSWSQLAESWVDIMNKMPTPGQDAKVENPKAQPAGLPPGAGGGGSAAP